MASLVAVEQPRTILLAETSTDSTHPDVPLEKAPLLDTEVAIFKEEPLTASMRNTVRHLISIGGAGARWRGLGASITYHIAHSVCMNLVCAMFGQSSPTIYARIPYCVAWILSGVFLSTIHATWTQVMISQPSALPWWKRISGGRQMYKALILPSLVYAVAQLALVMIPFAIFSAFAPAVAYGREFVAEDQKRAIAGAISALGAAFFIGLAVVLPASVTLTRVEASLLPEDQEIIVNFDRTLGGAAISSTRLATSDYTAMFVGAWKSFDRASRARLIKFYVKMSLLLSFIVFAGVMAVTCEILAFGPERLKTFALATVAQLEQMASGN